jgi:hypothetical protein
MRKALEQCGQQDGNGIVTAAEHEQEDDKQTRDNEPSVPLLLRHVLLH